MDPSFQRPSLSESSYPFELFNVLQNWWSNQWSFSTFLRICCGWIWKELTVLCVVIVIIVSISPFWKNLYWSDLKKEAFKSKVNKRQITVNLIYINGADVLCMSINRLVYFVTYILVVWNIKTVFVHKMDEVAIFKMWLMGFMFCCGVWYNWYAILHIQACFRSCGFTVDISL